MFLLTPTHNNHFTSQNSVGQTFNSMEWGCSMTPWGLNLPPPGLSLSTWSHRAEDYSELKSLPDASRASFPRGYTLLKPLFLSCFIIFHWPKQIWWPSPESVFAATKVKACHIVGGMLVFHLGHIDSDGSIWYQSRKSQVTIWVWD